MDSLLNLINKNILFENKMYKIVKLSRIYIYGLQYKTDKQLVLNDDILLHSIGNKQFLQVIFKRIRTKPTKFSISNFNNYK